MMYFAYGSNLHKPQMAERCPESRPAGAATLPGHRLTFQGESKRWGGGVANVVEDPTASVPGLLYDTTDACLEALDRFEGHPRFYRRTEVTVVRDGAEVTAVTYMRVDAPPPRAPSAAYLGTIAHAYGTLGYPLAPLLAAANVTPR